MSNILPPFLGYELTVSVVGSGLDYRGQVARTHGAVISEAVAVEPAVVLEPDTLADLAEGDETVVMLRLTSQPYDRVNVFVGSSDQSELTVSTPELVFSYRDWNTAKPLTLTGVADNLVDGTKQVLVTYEIVSYDYAYGRLPDLSQSLAVTDGNAASLTFRPSLLPVIPESGGTTVTVRLATAVETGVTLAFTSLDTAAATLREFSNPARLTTTTDEVVVTLFATAYENTGTPSDRSYGLRVSVISGPTGYAGLQQTVFGTVVDADAARLVLDPPTLTDLAEDTTSTVMVKLATQPTSGVTVTVSSSDTDEFSVSPAELVFTSSDWATARPVTLSGEADSLVDETQPVAVTYDLSSLDASYNAVPDVTQPLNVTDTDVAGLVTDPTTLPSIDEYGGTATVTLRLMTAVETAVTLAFTSPDPSATLSSTSQRATLRTLADSATVTLWAVDDFSADGDRQYALQVSVVSGPGDYAGLTLSVTGLLVDIDSPHLVLDPPSLPDVAEGDETQVMLRLATAPSAIVTVSIASGDSSELLVSPASLEFTPTNWNTAQPVTLSGDADSLVDGTQLVTVTYGLSSSGDTGYGSLSDVTQPMNVTDVNAAGLVLDPTTLTTINEDGGIATVILHLMTTAESGVTLSITSSFPAVATLTATPLLATLTTVADRATVTLGAVDDNSATGNRPYALLVSVVSGPGGYAGLELTVTGTVLDDDEASLDLDPSSLADLAEGESSTVGIMLGSEPTATVTVSVSVSDETEMSVSSVSLEFTPGNWNQEQEVEVSGLADNAVDGTQAVTVTYGLSSSDLIYAALPAATQSLNVTDVDVPGFVIIPDPLPDINESGGAVIVTVRLSTAVDPGVTLSLTSPFPAVATLTATPLLATLTTLADSATVTLGAVDDNSATGDRNYALQVSVVSGPIGYAGLELTVTGTVLDDDEASLELDPSSLADLAEGASSTVGIMLGSEPTATVTVSVSVSDETELSVSSVSLEFTPGNWNQEQEVEVSGLADNAVDGIQAVTVTYGLSSSDLVYAALPAATQSLNVTDVDVPGFVIIPDPLPDINENGGAVIVTVRLSKAVDPGVTLSLTSPFPAVATLTATPLLATLTTLADSATVTLMAVDNGVATGNRPYALQVSVVSGPIGYAGLERIVTGTVLDDDEASLELDPSSLTDLAEGASSTVGIMLGSEPTATVTVSVSVSDETELSVSSVSLEFTPGNWNQEQEVEVSGLADSLVDGTQAVTVTYGLSSSGPVYGNSPDVTQSLGVTDVDVPGFVLTPDPLPDINEEGGTATVTLSLMTAGEGAVTLSITSPFPAVATLTASPLLATLTTTADSATVTLGAVAGMVATGDRRYALQVSVVSGPGGYAGLELTVTGTVLDDEVASLDLDPSSLTDLAEGASLTVGIMLGSEPTATVTVSVSVSDETELSVSSVSLEFTPGNWNQEQEVEVSGLADNAVDGIQAVTVTYGLSSSDLVYAALPAATQSLNVTDVDVSGFVILPDPLPDINESGGAVIVTVRLSTAVDPGVTLSLTSPFPAVATLTATPLLATLTTLADSATVTLMAVDNGVATGDRNYALQVSVVSGPIGYAGLERIVTGTVLDDEVASLDLDPSSLTDLAEGASSTVGIMLGSEPTATVTVSVSVSDETELSVSSVSLEFTPGNWNQEQEVEVSGLADNAVDGIQAVTVTYGLSSSDLVYAALPAATQSLNVTDVDVPGFVILPDPLPDINESGGAVIVTVRLSTAVDPGVTLSLTSPFPAVATLAATPLLATLTTLADSATVTLMAVDNGVATGNRNYALQVSVVSGPIGYAGLERIVTGTVLDDEVASLDLDPSSLTDLAEGASSTVGIMLGSEPTATVTVSVSVSDDSELSVSSVSLEFTPGNWNQEQEVEVSGLADSLVDGTQAVTVTYGLSSSDPVYGNSPDVTQSLGVADADVAALVSDPTTLPAINEEGGTTTVTVRLATAAEGGVALSFTSPFPEVATLSATAITATLTTAADSATVTLGAVNDDVDSNNRGYALEVSVVSGPGAYAGLEMTVTGSVTDDDQASLDIDPSLLANLAEGASSTVGIMLGSEPTATVTVSVSVSDDSELTVSSVSLEFTPGNWNQAQEVEVSGLADSLVDGTQAVTVTYGLSSSDTVYNAVPNVTLSLDVIDRNRGSFVFIPSSLPNIPESSGLATVTVRLGTAAEGGVTLSFTSFDTAFATLTAASIPATLTTTAQEAVVTLFAVPNDLVGSGTQSYGLRVSVTSGPADYSGRLTVAFGEVTDDDVANLVLSPTSLPDVAEGATETVMVKLESEPTANVTVSVSSDDSGELLISPASLVFTSANWSTAQPVSLSGVADNLVDGTQSVTVTYGLSSGDTAYAALSDVSRSLGVTDGNTASFTFIPSSLPDIAEFGGMETVTVRLETAVETGVTLALTSLDTAAATLTSALIPATLTTTTDEAVVRLFATALEHIDTPNDRIYGLKVLVTSGPVGYAGLQQTISGTVIDDDEAGLSGLSSSLTSVAEGDTEPILVQLSSEPTSDVTVSISSSDTGELTVSPSQLVFTAANWSVSQPVTPSGKVDNLVDDTQAVVVTYNFSSLDAVYNIIPSVLQSLDVTDSDTARLVLEPATLPDINEDGGPARVTVRLMTAVETGVTLSFTSPGSATTLSSASLLASLTTVADRVTVTIGAVDDTSATGDRPYALLVSVVSGPGGYSGLTLSVSGMVRDDDVPNLVLAPTSLPDVAEGDDSQVMVRLATQPTATVTVTVSPGDQGELSVSPIKLVFTATNWDSARPVVLSGVEDGLVDGTQTVTVTYTVSSSDSGYGGLAPRTQSLGVADADVAALVSDPTTLPTINEEGGTTTVTVRLATAAEGGVALSFTSPFPEVATLSATAITATLTTASDRATVTLGAVNDDIDSNDRGYALEVSVVSGPGAFAGLELTVTGSVTDDDQASLALDPPSLSNLSEVGSSQVMVKLATQPTSDVTVAVSSSDTGELAVSPARLMFLTTNWSTPQPVMLSGSEDNLVDGAQTVTVTYAVSSSDSGYGGLPESTQSLVVSDLDRGGLALEPAALPPLSEPDGAATVSLRLTKSSPSPVTLAVWSSDPSIATLSSPTLTLILMSELDNGAVALRAVNDDEDNPGIGGRSYNLIASVLNTEGGYASVMLTASGKVVDDDAVGVRFLPAVLPRIDEGGSLTVSVALGATPTAPVTLEVSSENPLVATLSPAIVTITLDASRLSEPVTISGATNTMLADMAYTLTVNVVGTGTNYDGQFASASGIVVSDDARMVATPAELGDIPWEDGSVTVELRLGAVPTMEVNVNIGNAAPTGATLVGTSQSPTFMMDDLADRVVVTLVAVNDEGVYPREFGLLVTMEATHADDASFNTVLTLMGMVIVPSIPIESAFPSEPVAMLQVAVADIASAGLVIDLVSDNIDGGESEGPRAQIGGRSVTGLSATVGLSPSQSPDPWNDSDPWSEPDVDEWQDGMGLVSGSGFVLPLSSGASAGTSTELWGGARYSDLSGEPSITGVRHSYDGDAVAVHVGVTRRYASGTSAGFSIGHSWVDLEVSAVGDDEVVKARRRLLSVHPYVSLAPFPSTRLLLVAGYGDGTYSTVGNEDRKASTRMVSGRLERDWQLGGIDLTGKLGVLSVESELEAEAASAVALRGGSLQSRVEMEFSKSFAPGSGMSLRPYGSLGYLHESGTVDTEGGAELGAGLKGSWDAGFDADISARYQLEGAKRSERKLEGRLSFDWGQDRRGLLLDVSQEHSLSEEADGNSSLGSEYKARVGHGWGRTLWRRRGVLGAYVSTVEGSGNDDSHGPRLGVSFEAESLEIVAEQGIGESRLHLNYVTNF